MPSYSSNSAMRSAIDAQVNFMTELPRRSYDSVRKLSELNLYFAQQLMQDSIDATRQVLACSDPLQMTSMLTNAAQPAAQHLRSYQQQLISMLTGAQVELVRNAESLVPQCSRYAAALAQAIAEEALAGGGPLTNASRANGASANSTGTVHHAH